jgi:hypothetical protein
VSTGDWRDDRARGKTREQQQQGEEEEKGQADWDRMRLLAMRRRQVQRKAARQAAGGAKIPEGAGSALGGDAQLRMQEQLGADLSGVRVHTSAESAAAADKFGARAFTVGHDVHFAAGEFAPGTKDGDRLLAHELTHTIQAQRSGVQRKPSANGEHDAAHGKQDVSQPGDPAEIEADAAGDHVADALHGDEAKHPHQGPGGKEKAPQIAAKLATSSIALAKKGEKEEPAKGKPVNLPAWKDIIIDIAHIASGHVAGGARASEKKDKFPPGMTPEKIESAVRNAYKVCKKLQTQGERVLVVGTADGLTIEMWVNVATKTIETAYPQY